MRTIIGLNNALDEIIETEKAVKAYNVNAFGEYEYAGIFRINLSIRIAKDDAERRIKELNYVGSYFSTEWILLEKILFALNLLERTIQIRMVS